ncbi:SET domain-containing protein [Histomonas meleagridis]|uniref:SET domain-containing protein n=1 Tax=Histomonas meleagridis TaxID=135588 RepID=UPI00355ACC4C|nr:SET domain-containing protein [Histomonas meleagridis]
MSCYALNPLKYRPTPEQITQTRAWYYSEKERTTPMQPQAETLQNDTIEEFERVLRSNSMTLRYDRSIIHQWGVITTRKHKLGDPLIEYVGELIRLSVVEKRQKMYEREGNNGSYIFRLSDDVFIDATRVGGKARFINHSCDPNCETILEEFFGEKHIIICAIRDIEPYEELVYDYKIEYEPKEKRIKCCCGSPRCKGWLNWNESFDEETETVKAQKRETPYSNIKICDN